LFAVDCFIPTVRKFVKIYFGDKSGSSMSF